MMKRDMDLIREILLEVEEKGHGYRGFHFEVPREEIESEQGKKGYHLDLLIDANLVIGRVTRDSSGLMCSADKLTWQGHEFLDAAREPTRWNQTKNLILDKIGGASIAVWTKVLTAKMLEQIG